MPIDPEGGWEDIGEDEGWEDIAPTPKKKNAFSALRGAEIKAQPSLLSRVGSQAKGFLQELPLIASRGVGLAQDLAQGKAPWDPAIASERASREAKINEWLGAAKPGEEEKRTGRVLARMVPGAAAAYLTGGMSLPAQGVIQGGVQGLQSLSEGASPESAATGAGIAGFAPFAGKAINALVSKAKAPFAASVDQPAIRAFDRLNVEPPASAVTHSRPAQLMEQASGFGLGGQRVTNRAEEALSGLTAKADELAAGADRSAGGVSLADDYAAARASLQGAKNAEYAKVGDLTGIRAVPEQTLAEIDRLLAQGTLDPDTLANLRKLREAVAPVPVPDPVDPALEKLIRRNANSPTLVEALEAQKPRAQGPPTPRTAADLMSQQAGIEYGGPNAMRDAGLGNRIRQNLGADIDTSIGVAAPEQLAQLRKAKEAYGRYADLSESVTGRTVSKLAEAGQFDKVIPSIVKPGASVKDIRTVLSISKPGTVNQVRKNILADIVGATGDAEVKLTPEKIASGIKRWKPELLREVLDKEQYQRLQDLATASRAMGKASRISGGSQTAPLLRASQYLSYPPALLSLILTGNVGAAAGLAGTAGLEAATAAGVGSKAGQQWLTKGFGKAVVPGRLARAGSVPLSRIPSEVEMDRRRRELDALLAGAQ